MPNKILLIIALIGCRLSIAQTLPEHYYHIPANSGVNNLFFNDAACEKFQFIYTLSEIANMVTNVTGPVSIDTIWFRFGGGSSNPTTVLSNFEIRMGHTTLTNPGTQFNTNFNAGAPQTVLSSGSYSLTPIIGAAGDPTDNWTYIVLQTPFAYNFTDNLCVELSFSSSSAAIAGNFADNGGLPISQYAGNSTASTASATSSRPMFGISSGQGSSGSNNCNPNGNLIIYSNYDGGILTINVDQNIPNLKVGICTYEPIQVAFTGPFVGNITEVIYAGMNSNQNNNNCGLGNFTTSVTGVPAGVVTISPPMNPPLVGYTPAHGNGSGPWGGGMLGVAGFCDTTINAGGGNTPDEVVYYFLNATSGTLLYHQTQYDCWLNETLNVSAGGNCCILPPGVNPCPPVTATSSQINVTCSGGSDGSATVVASGGTTFTYSWSPSGGSTATANGLSAGVYTCTITNECGNSTSETVTITETNVYQLNATVVQPTCGEDNGCISFAPTPAGTYFYSWPFPTNMIVDSVCNLSPGSYDITINSADGCPIDTTIIIAESFSFNVVETITPANCVAADGAISVSAVGGTAPFTYSWSTGGSSGNTLTNLTAGIYSVTITDQNGCIVTESYTVPQVNTFSFDVLPSSATISIGESIQLTANGATSYSWSPSSSLSCNDCSAPIANPTSTTTYTVTGTDENGCTSTAQATISLAIDCDEVFVPTIFSPNGSGPEINDLLCVMGNCISQLRYSIYNRWGDLVFSTEDISICWDGTCKGKPCQTGVYAYSLVVTKTNGETIVQSGNLTLIK
jgi:gliding motility-associated-like protein